MKLAFVVSGLQRGGAERQLAQLAIGLTRRGHDIAVMSTRDGPYRAELEAAHVPVLVVDSHGPMGGLRARWRLTRAIRAARPQIVHPYLTSTNTWVTWLRPLLGDPSIVWGVRDSGTDPSLYGLKARIAFGAARMASRRADLIVANSEAGAHNYAALGYPAERIIVIPNGIDTERFRPDPDRRSAVRAELDVPPSTLVVGMLARYDPVKGHDDFVDAAAMAARICEVPLRFVIAGDHPVDQRDRLMARARSGEVALTILPTQPRPQELLTAFDVLVMPSRLAEGFPNVIGEALAVGVPVVATDVGDARQLIEGVGEVVEPARPDLLADAIARVVADESGAGGGSAATAALRRRRVEERYSIDRLVSRTEAILLQLLGAEPISDRGSKR